MDDHYDSRCRKSVKRHRSSIPLGRNIASAFDVSTRSNSSDSFRLRVEEEDSEVQEFDRYYQEKL